MSISVFLELVEIKAKTASIFPFLLGTFYAYYHYRTLHLGALFLFFIAMLMFNMAVDANDNYQDYQRALKTQALAYRKNTNIIGVHHLSLKTIRHLIIWLVLLSALIGLYIVYLTGLPLLWLGLFSYAVGYFYASGPRPISTTPFGEFFSGITMGFVIVLIAVYINAFNITTFNWDFIKPILLSSGLFVFSIANLMFANNICDYQEDIALGRKTLVYYLGVKRALFFFKAFYVLGFITLLISLYYHILPLSTALVLLLIPVIIQKTHKFSQNPHKKQTFPLIIQNLLLITLTETIGFGIGLFI